MTRSSQKQMEDYREGDFISPIRVLGTAAGGQTGASSDERLALGKGQHETLRRLALPRARHDNAAAQRHAVGWMSANVPRERTC